MIEDLKEFLKDIQSLPRKLQILSIISLNKIESVDKKNFDKGIPFEVGEIKTIQKLNNPYFLKFLYINKDKVHDN